MYRTLAELLHLKYQMDLAAIPMDDRAVVLHRKHWEGHVLSRATMIAGFRIIWATEEYSL